MSAGQEAASAARVRHGVQGAWGARSSGRHRWELGTRPSTHNPSPVVFGDLVPMRAYKEAREYLEFIFCIYSGVCIYVRSRHVAMGAAGLSLTP